MLTGGSPFALFITINVVITSIAIFDGIIILIALATDWFDVSGFYLSFFFFFVGDSVAKLFKTFPNVRSYIFQLFFCPSGKLFDILPWHGDNMLFLQMFH